MLPVNLQNFRMRIPMSWMQLSAVIVLASTLASLVTMPVMAHVRVEVDSYVLIIGWAMEPVIVGERNAIRIQVTEDGTPVEGLEATLDVETFYGGQTMIGNLTPTAEPGIYEAEILPTVRGQYEVHLSGTIGEMEVDIVVEPEEVLSATVLQFPESVPDGRELKASIMKLDSKVSSMQMIALVALIFALVGLVVSVISLLRGRRHLNLNSSNLR